MNFLILLISWYRPPGVQDSYLLGFPVWSFVAILMCGAHAFFNLASGFYWWDLQTDKQPEEEPEVEPQ